MSEGSGGDRVGGDRRQGHRGGGAGLGEALGDGSSPWLCGSRPPRPTRAAQPFLHRDVRALGITLMGHQKKILGSIQTMRAQLTNTQGPRRHL